MAASSTPSKKDTHILRAITFTVISPLDGDWKELREALKLAWRESTCLANWAVTELAKADVIRKPGDTKIPKMPPIYLYGLAKSGQYPGWAHWDGGKSAAQCILRNVEQNYRERRIDVIWRRSASLPSYRYPHPYPIHNDLWTATLEQGVPVVELPIGGRRWRLRLKGGPMYHRQLRSLTQIVSGEAKQCEAAIFQRGEDLRLKLVAWFPREASQAGEHVMVVRTDPNAMLVAEIDGDSKNPFIINRDDIKRRVAVHNIWRQRMSEDLKYEKRWPQKHRRGMREALEKRCEKQNNFLDNVCHQLSACLANYAARRKVGEVIFDQDCKSYVESFPWSKFAQRLQYKLDALGIQLTTKEASANEGE